MSWTDGLSAISGLVAALIALVTLFTVYVAAVQLFLKLQIDREGLSDSALGPWKPKVLSSSFLGLKRMISTPHITVLDLIEKEWKPEYCFPSGLSQSQHEGVTSDIENQRQRSKFAEASWVTFMQILGITPADKNLFEMRVEPVSFNGRIPMRWRGHDLVLFCSTLGFQSCEDIPSVKMPMPMPMRWAGPLGYLNFRSGFETCIVEFRPRTWMPNQLPEEFYEFYSKKGSQDTPLISRICYAIGAYYLHFQGTKSCGDSRTGRVFYVGGFDAKRRRYNKIIAKKLRERIERNREESSGEESSEEGSSKGGSSEEESLDEEEGAVEGSQPENRSDEGGPEVELEQGIGHKKPRGENKSKNRGEQRAGATPKADGDSAKLLNAALKSLYRKISKKKTPRSTDCKIVLEECPGLFSTVLEGEMATSAGIDLSDCIEYHQVATPESKIDRSTYPYNLDMFYMDKHTLSLFRVAIIQLQPDGFYFSPEIPFKVKITIIYGHVKDYLHKKLPIIFPRSCESDWKGWGQDLYQAANLLNAMHLLRRTARTTFSVSDMVIIMKAVVRLRALMKPVGYDLFWSLIVCPKLFQWVANITQGTPSGVTDILRAEFIIKDEVLIMSDADGEKADTKSKNKPSTTSETSKSSAPGTSASASSNTVTSTGITEPADQSLEDSRFPVPAAADGTFTGVHLMAAFMNVCLTFFWIEKSWNSDVIRYHVTVPNSVMMS